MKSMNENCDTSVGLCWCGTCFESQTVIGMQIIHHLEESYQNVLNNSLKKNSFN